MTNHNIILTVLMASGLASLAYGGERLEFGGDIRLGAFGYDVTSRDGDNAKRDDLRLRIRAGVKVNITESTMAKVRLAGRYSSDERLNTYHFEVFESSPSSYGLRLGDSTIDQFYLQHQMNEYVNIKLGRFQTGFNLAGVAPKSLSRNDVNLTWTDGAYMKYAADNGWDYHAIVQRSKDEGPTTIRHEPLSFADNSSHNTFYVAIENIDGQGLFVQKSVDVTYIPDVLHTEGKQSDKLNDYLAVSSRIAAEWDLGLSGTKLIWGNEFAYAVNTPDKAAISTGGNSASSGFAYQTIISFKDVWPSHSFALSYGHVGGGWLLSGDYANNQQLAEAFYEWKVNTKHKLEARLRSNKDIDKHIVEPRKRRGWDYYLRYTIGF